MDQQLEVQGFDFSIIRDEDKRERARELDTQCGAAIQKLSYTVDEIAEICTEMKSILPHGHFERWYEGRGLTDNQVQYAMKRIRDREKAALKMIEKPEIQAFQSHEQVVLLDQAESKQDDEKDRKLAELEQTIRIANDRLFSIEGQVAHYKQQALIAQSQAAQPPKTVEKRVEVVPQHVLDHQKELQERLRALQTEKAQLQAQALQVKKERDLYKRDLDKERQNDNALFLKNLESEGEARLRANFAEAMREIVAWCRSSSMKLPSFVDTHVFEVDDWRRLDEALQAHERLGYELQKLKNTVSSSSVQQSFVVDALESVVGR